jgi:aspartate-semialdehyde dehydrogenase
MRKISVGVLGATGMVGQRFVQLLADHPWFEITALAASDRSAGRSYVEACHWLLPTSMPEAVCEIPVQPVEPTLDCQLVFSALPSRVAREVEGGFAQAGYGVCSNASAHRLDPDVPLLIPEINPDHTALIPVQRRRRGWGGFIVTSANCSTTQLALVLKPLHQAFGVRKLSVVTLQAVSGAGYPGVPSLDILDNVIPFIDGEEHKLEREPRKLLGTLQDEPSSDVDIVEAPFVISAQCNRVPVRDGHTECVSIAFEHDAVSREASDRGRIEDVIAALEAFEGSPDVAALPSSVARPIQVLRDLDRPQPIRDREVGAGMVVTVGRVRPCPVLDVRFVVLGHNTLRGAAGGAIHNAELLMAQGWLEDLPITNYGV